MKSLLLVALLLMAGPSLCQASSPTNTVKTQAPNSFVPPVVREIRAPKAQGPSASCSAATSRDAVWLALISGASGVFGALVVALMNHLTARKTSQSTLQIENTKLRATLITAERLRWLQDIRERVAKLFRLTDMQYSHLKRPRLQVLSENQAVLDSMSEEIVQQSNMIVLILNPKKPEQEALRTSVQSVLAFLMPYFNITAPRPTNSSDEEYTAIKQAAFDSLTTIGEKAWAKIKTLDQPDFY